MIDESLRTGRLTLGPIGARLEEAFARAPRRPARGGGRIRHERAGDRPPHARRRRARRHRAREHVPRHRGRGARRRGDAAVRRLRPCNAGARRRQSVGALVGPRTAAVVVVHIGGYVAPSVLELRRRCDDAGVALVEDAAHAHGASLDGRSAGTFGVAGTFSFYPTKVIAGGEGGMIVTDDDAHRRRGAHLPRPGQGVVPHQPPHAAGQQLADERAARRDRAVPAAPARRVHRRAPARSPSATTPRSPTLGLTPVAIPADGDDATTTSTSPILPDGIDRAVFKKRLREEYDVACRARCTTCRCTSSRCSSRGPTGRCPAPRELCARHVCLPVYGGR